MAGYRAHDTNRAGAFFQECLNEMDMAIDTLKGISEKEVLKNLRILKALTSLNVRSNYRSKKKSRSYTFSPINMVSKTLYPRLLDESAYPVLTPDRFGNWEESTIPFLLG